MKTIAASKVTFFPKTREPFWSFSVSSLILISTAVACGCTLAVRLPGLGFVAGTLLVVVTIRTLLVIKRRREKGIFTSRGEKAWLFLRSLLRATFVVFSFCASIVGSFLFAVIGLMLAASAGYAAPSATAVIVIAWLLPLLLLGSLLSGFKRRFDRDVCLR
jgi:hypothetical protein